MPHERHERFDRKKKRFDGTVDEVNLNAVTHSNQQYAADRQIDHY